MNSPDQCRIW